MVLALVRTSALTCRCWLAMRVTTVTLTWLYRREDIVMMIVKAALLHGDGGGMRMVTDMDYGICVVKHMYVEGHAGPTAHVGPKSPLECIAKEAMRMKRVGVTMRPVVIHRNRVAEKPQGRAPARMIPLVVLS